MTVVTRLVANCIKATGKGPRALLISKALIDDFEARLFPEHVREYTKTPGEPNKLCGYQVFRVLDSDNVIALLV